MNFHKGHVRTFRVHHRTKRWEELINRWTTGKVQLQTVKDLDRLVMDYRRVLSEIAWLKTVDPDSPYLEKLDDVARQLHWLLHQESDKPIASNPLRLWLELIPSIFQKHIAVFHFVLTVFFLGVLFTFTLVSLEDRFALSVLPPDVLLMIQQGVTWLDQPEKLPPPELMSFSIIHNNTMVAVYLYITGVTFGIGTFYILWKNIMMLGAIFALAIKYNAVKSIYQFILAHGFLEISALLVEATAGFILAKGLLERRRVAQKVTFRSHAKESWLLFLGTLPWIVLAGLVEGYISREYPHIPVEFRMALGVLLSLLLWIFLFRPVRVHEPYSWDSHFSRHILSPHT